MAFVLRTASPRRIFAHVRAACRRGAAPAEVADRPALMPAQQL
jgi:hypothetical protein